MNPVTKKNMAKLEHVRQNLNCSLVSSQLLAKHTRNDKQLDNLTENKRKMHGRLSDFYKYNEMLVPVRPSVDLCW